MSVSNKPMIVMPSATISTPLTDTTHAKLFLHMPNTIIKAWSKEVDRPQQDFRVIDSTSASQARTAVAGITLVVNFDSAGCDTAGTFYDPHKPPPKSTVEGWQSGSTAWVTFENAIQRAVDQLNNACRAGATKSGSRECDRLQPLLVVTDTVEGLHGTLDGLCVQIPDKYMMKIAGISPDKVTSAASIDELRSSENKVNLGCILRGHNSEEYLEPDII